MVYRRLHRIPVSQIKYSEVSGQIKALMNVGSKKCKEDQSKKVRVDGARPEWSERACVLTWFVYILGLAFLALHNQP
jgi:hypothetical protein